MSTSLRQLADELFARISPYEGDGLHNHCLRLHRFFCLLLEQSGAEPTVDSDLAYLIALVHDLGLLTGSVAGDSYLERSRNLFQRETRDLELPLDRRIIDEALLYNHRLVPPPGLCPQAECLRRAVLMEHTRGLLRFGLDQAAVSAVFAHHPRADFDRVLVDFAWRVLRHEPHTIVHGIFF